MTIPATNPPAPEFKPHGPIMRVPDWNKAQAAIALKVPMSGIPELDAMIRESRRLDMATAAMQGIIADPNVDGSNHDTYAEFMAALANDSFDIADAMLAASGEEKP